MNHKGLLSRIFLFLSAFPLAVAIHPMQAFSETEHQVYFPNTVYELNIYRINGKNAGKTLMLIGGIQGNEPGGFLSADLYADMHLEKGNLIVVPRANFYSIILNQRGPNGDMNRKFTHKDNSSSTEDKIVSILKRLISESDFLLNLHDGSGYYYPEYIDKWRNPSRFGQSIIADCDKFHIPGTDEVIPLGDMARRVIEEVNQHINHSLYKFHFMDTRTAEEDSAHKEQRSSATYYALTVHHIPAFGVETSKFLPSIDLKVWFHNLVINAFMELFGIIPQSPGMNLDAPLLKYLIVSINGEIPIVINTNESVYLSKGDTINVSHIEANYERGLSLDILGYGDMNDYRKNLSIFRNTSIIVRKDNNNFGEIPVRITGRGFKGQEGNSIPERIDYFIIETKGQRLLLSEGETLEVVRGDSLKIIDVFPFSLPGITVNFKGFVGDWRNNTGEDRGYEIDTSRDLMENYSINKKGECYPIIVSKGDKKLGSLTVKLIPPLVHYMILKVNDDRHVLLRPEDSVSLSFEDKISMEEIQTNLYNKSGIHLTINGHKVGFEDLLDLRDLCNCGLNQLNILKGPLALGKIFINAEIN
jgi:hypothetical protein